MIDSASETPYSRISLSLRRRIYISQIPRLMNYGLYEDL